MIKKLVVGSMATNCYIVGGIIIDPGDDAEYITSHLTSKPTMIIATHGHFDHIMAAFFLQRTYDIPFAMHKNDEFLLTNMQRSAKHFLGIARVDPPPKITKYLSDGDAVENLKVMHTPGHTPGSICLVGKQFVFTGDTVFADGGVGRTDFSYSSKQALTTSAKKILDFPGDTELLSGHGQSTIVRKEKTFHRV